MESITIYLFTNCEILTIDEKDSIAEAMAIFNDKILAVGSDLTVITEINQFIEEMASKRPEKFEIKPVKLDGAWIVPGFVEADLDSGTIIYEKKLLNMSMVNIIGSLQKGRFANFVILEKNPMSVPSEELGNIKILATWHRGKAIYLP